MASLNTPIETKGGFEYDGADCQAWMREAAFSATRVERLVGGHSMAVGSKSTERKSPAPLGARSTAGAADPLQPRPWKVVRRAPKVRRVRAGTVLQLPVWRRLDLATRPPIPTIEPAFDMRSRKT